MTAILTEEPVLHIGVGSRWAAAARDVRDALGASRLWLTMGWNDVLQRYRRSLLGPFWLTISMGIMVGALGFLYSQLFRMPTAELLPYLALGLLVWTFIMSLMIEGCHIFIGSEAFIKQVRLPFSLHALRCVWRNAIVFAHNVLIYVVVVLYYDLDPGWTALLALPGLLLIVLASVSLCLIFGLLSARFRDIPQIVANATQVLFFVTPIIWKPALLEGQGRQYIANINPFHHYIDIVRAPLLGDVPATLSYQVAIGGTVLLAGLAFLLLALFRRRIAYWL